MRVKNPEYPDLPDFNLQSLWLGDSPRKGQRAFHSHGPHVLCNDTACNNSGANVADAQETRHVHGFHEQLAPACIYLLGGGRLACGSQRAPMRRISFSPHGLKSSKEMLGQFQETGAVLMSRNCCQVTQRSVLLLPEKRYVHRQIQLIGFKGRVYLCD